MTWKQVNWILQWGSTGGGNRILEVGSPRVVPWKLTFHFPPGVPLWIPVKGEIYLRQTFTPPTRGRLLPTRRARWWTLRKNYLGSRRWADRGNLSPAGLTSGVKGLIGVFRPVEFDFSGWKFQLRGTHSGGWEIGISGEIHLLRPRYV